MNDKTFQEQTIGLFGKEVADEINDFLENQCNITVDE